MIRNDGFVVLEGLFCLIPPPPQAEILNSPGSPIELWQTCLGISPLSIDAPLPGSSAVLNYFIPALLSFRSCKRSLYSVLMFIVMQFSQKFSIPKKFSITTQHLYHEYFCYSLLGAI